MISKAKSADFTIQTQWRLECEPEELTKIILDPELIHLWCPSVFLNSDLIDRGAPDGMGMTIRLHTKGWLPHSFYFVAEIVELVRHKSMTLELDGDFDGIGEMEISPTGQGECIANMRWQVDIRQPQIKYFARYLRPIFVANHKWAVRRARNLMQQEVYRRRIRSNKFTSAKPTFPHNILAYRFRKRARAEKMGWDETGSNYGLKK